MRIHNPQLERVNGKVRLSASVETDGGAGLYPDALWFEVPQEFGGLVYTGIEPFVVALLPLAMKLGEEIRCDSLFSPRLAYHLRSAAGVLNHMEPSVFKPVEVQSMGLMPDPPQRAPGVGLMFSGGVDAFYALLRHRPGVQAIPDYTLTHGIFLSNFEYSKQRVESDEKALAVFKKLFDRLGLKLIHASHNARGFRESSTPASSRQWHLRTLRYELAATGIFLSGGLGRLLLASSQPFTSYSAHIGGDFEIDMQHATEWLEIVHDGLVEDRVIKTIALAEWPESYDALRVCWWEMDGVQNCGRCPKCVRTMTSLAAIGRLDCYSTFPKPFRVQSALNQLSTIQGSFFLKRIRDLARANGRPGLAAWISLAFLISRLRASIKWLITLINPGYKKM